MNEKVGKEIPIPTSDVLINTYAKYLSRAGSLEHLYKVLPEEYKEPPSPIPSFSYHLIAYFLGIKKAIEEGLFILKENDELELTEKTIELESILQTKVNYQKLSECLRKGFEEEWM